MANRLYVGNLDFAVDEATLEAFLRENGVNFEKVELARDVSTGRQRGFGFVQLELGQDLNAAIEATNGKTLSKRQVTVSEARERPPRDAGRRGRFGRGRDGRSGRR